MSRASLKALRLFACVLSLSLAVGCGDPCLTLADKVCSCQPDDNSRAACSQQAREAETVFAVSGDVKNKCQSLLDADLCKCETLNTPEGRNACGLTITAR